VNDDKDVNKSIGLLIVGLVLLVIVILGFKPYVYPPHYDESPEVEYGVVNVTARELRREAYSYLDDNGTLVWENRYLISVDFHIEMTYHAEGRGDIEVIDFWIEDDNATVAYGPWGGGWRLDPGETRTFEGTYNPGVWLDKDAILTVGFSFWHTYVSSNYIGHSGIGRTEVAVEAPWGTSAQ